MVVEAFPRLATESHRITSPATSEYNCIAWAAGDTETWWWPIPAEDACWPAGAPRARSLDAFEEAFRLLGYQPCADDQLEPGFEKVAIYANPDGKPTHAARQLPSGRWTSKLGQQVDIEHQSPSSLCGPVYGEPALFLKRPRS